LTGTSKDALDSIASTRLQNDKQQKEPSRVTSKAFGYLRLPFSGELWIRRI